MSAAVTSRQIEILRLVARGMTSKEIARHEGISLHTVNTHVRRARSTLGVGTRAAAVALIVRRRVRAAR
ncbi:MAG TPA: helix-turn-helix transcriptional regulator [Candidatus Limnocylindrales bacterium]|nr:helix-turn-helix transcriptional regulator [Candidatus Limnocylindrales bacterium]